MSKNFYFYSYTPRMAKKIKQNISDQLSNSWLEKDSDLISQICSELIKNAIKSNYKFLLLWKEIERHISISNPQWDKKEIDEWLKTIFFSGETILLEKQIKNIPHQEVITKKIREIIDLEYLQFNKKGKERPEVPTGHQSTYQDLYNLKKSAMYRKVITKWEIERNTEQIIFSTINTCPILQHDIERIYHVRKVYREYYDAGRQEYFFVENIDTSGGGHGLGYALMDSILLEIGLEPSNSLYLVPGGNTMVVLVLPTKKP